MNNPQRSAQQNHDPDNHFQVQGKRPHHLGGGRLEDGDGLDRVLCGLQLVRVSHGGRIERG